MWLLVGQLSVNFCNTIRYSWPETLIRPRKYIQFELIFKVNTLRITILNDGLDCSVRGRPELSIFFTYEITSHNFMSPSPPLLMRRVYIFRANKKMQQNGNGTLGCVFVDMNVNQYRENLCGLIIRTGIFFLSIV